MKFTVENVTNNHGPVIAMRCPHCGNDGTFHKIGTGFILQNVDTILGSRYCPNPKCKGHIFFACKPNGTLILTYPAITIPFNRDNIPENILKTFDEAITCHSTSCFTASAIMIRKTLEEICQEKEVTGKTLFLRLKGIGEKILIPKELLEAMNELRLLGNDAAHIEAKTFEQIGKEEIEISIEFTKEILKAIYQYDDLLSRLKKLKKTAGA